MKLHRGDRVGLLTSGGDAPGMNAAVRAAARVGQALGLEMIGVEDGYVGLIEGRMRPLDMRELDESARRGGTVLGSARSKLFPLPEGQASARKALIDNRLAGLVVIGGNGSLTGARTLRDVVRVAGVPASIDNDLACTSMAIGVDTAMNTIVEAVDRICDTATAHRRTFFIEVMGRDCGYLAMTSGIAAGADCVLIREMHKTEAEIVDQVVHAMQTAYGSHSSKRRVLVVKAEGVGIDSARLKMLVDERMAQLLPDVDTRVTILGHVVRGGGPSAFDRLLAARLANAAVHALADGQSDFMAGWAGPGVTGKPTAYDPYVILTPLETVLLETARLLAGESALGQWRKRIFEEIEPILAQ